ncbi:MAG: guanylate kinase [Acidobacteriota bacterium]|nr:guanylate kinase [Acidobacteriota bacterium]
MSNRGGLYVISGPSGSGKSSLANRALAEIPNLKFSVSHTTRKPRLGEQDSVEYFFVSEKEFKEMVQVGDFMEHACVFGHHYGTSKAHVETLRCAGHDVLLDIDVQGARQIHEAYTEAILIFVLPPSLEVLTCRLKERNLDDMSVIVNRLRIAKKEINSYRKYQYVIINEDYEKAVGELSAIIRDAGSDFRLDNRKERAEEIIKTFGGS